MPTDQKPPQQSAPDNEVPTRRSFGETRETESTVRARQATTGHGIHYVLIFSLAGIVAAFAALAFVSWQT